MKDKTAKRNKRKSDLLINLGLAGIMLAGILIVAYPTFSDWWNSFHQTRAIVSYMNRVSDIDEAEADAMFAQAEAYNAGLVENTARFVMSDDERAVYNSILDLTDTGIMGYVEVPKVHINLPIYHGMDDSVLQVAVGHLEGSSLPVGGIGTHAALTGHRGLPSARLFTDLDQLVLGDRFVITVLNRTMTYEIDQIRIVLPSQLEDLAIDPGMDYCTLITCTPYGINTHRLLLRGHRVENDPAFVEVKPDAVQIRTSIVAPLIAIPMLTITLLWVLISTSRKAAGVRRSRD